MTIALLVLSVLNLVAAISFVVMLNLIDNIFSNGDDNKYYTSRHGIVHSYK